MQASFAMEGGFVMNARLKKIRMVCLAGATAALMLALACTLAACGGSGSGSGSGGATSTPRTAEPNFDPATLSAGLSNNDTAGALTYTDYWYADGDSEHPALYFQNNSIMTPVFLNADGTEKTTKAGKTKIADGHLVPDGDADPTYDIVFDDPFTCYDSVSQTWFTRGDYTATLAKVVNTKWTSQQNGANSLELMEDGTAVFTGKFSSTGTWHLTAIDRIGIADDSESEMREYDLSYDGSGKVTSLEWTFEGYGYDRVD